MTTPNIELLDNFTISKIIDEKIKFTITPGDIEYLLNFCNSSKRFRNLCQNDPGWEELVDYIYGLKLKPKGMRKKSWMDIFIYYYNNYPLIKFNYGDFITLINHYNEKYVKPEWYIDLIEDEYGVYYNDYEGNPDLYPEIPSLVDEYLYDPALFLNDKGFYEGFIIVEANNDEYKYDIFVTRPIIEKLWIDLQWIEDPEGFEEYLEDVAFEEYYRRNEPSQEPIQNKTKTKKQKKAKSFFEEEIDDLLKYKYGL